MAWDYDQTAYDAQAKRDPAWELERMLTYGLNGRRIPRKLLEEHLVHVRIPQQRRDFLELLLWDKKF